VSGEPTFLQQLKQWFFSFFPSSKDSYKHSFLFEGACFFFMEKDNIDNNQYPGKLSIEHMTRAVAAGRPVRKQG